MQEMVMVMETVMEMEEELPLILKDHFAFIQVNGCLTSLEKGDICVETFLRTNNGNGNNNRNFKNVCMALPGSGSILFI